MFEFNSFTSHRLETLETIETPELQKRLGLYQVFLKLYEHHRELLDELLSLENSGNKSSAGIALPYIQAIVEDDQVCLMTNLVQGKTRSFSQPQNIWVIGRDSRQAGLAVPDRRLSRCHAAIRFERDRGFEIVDLNSSNGSFVNGEQVCKVAPLKDGDRIRLASLTIAFFVCNKSQSLPPISEATIALLQANTSKSSNPIAYRLHPSDPSEDPDDVTAFLPPADTIVFQPQSWTN